MGDHHLKSRLDDRIIGYVASFVAFSAITALWAFFVRGDDFYAQVLVSGVSVPVATIIYLLTMPVFGFIAGKWRYEAPTSPFGLGKALARSFNFIYSHLLIVLFTGAMITQSFLGWNIDAAVERIDDQLFEIASRFAPWLAAYLAGFNLGRATGLRDARSREAEDIAAAEARKPSSNRWFSTDEGAEDEKVQLTKQSTERASAAERASGDERDGASIDDRPHHQHSKEQFAFKRDSTLFDANGKRKTFNGRKQKRNTRPDPSKPAALFREPSHDPDTSLTSARTSTMNNDTGQFIASRDRQQLPSTSFDRLR